MKTREIKETGWKMFDWGIQENIKEYCAANELKKIDFRLLGQFYESAKESLLAAADLALVRRVAACLYDWGKIPSVDEISKFAAYVVDDLPLELKSIWARDWRERLKDNLWRFASFYRSPLDLGL